MTADENGESPVRINKTKMRLELLHSNAQNAESHIAILDRAVRRISRNSTTDTATAAPSLSASATQTSPGGCTMPMSIILALSGRERHFHRLSADFWNMSADGIA